MKRLLSAWTLSACTALFVAAAPAISQEKAKVPFELLPTQHMVVEIKVNGAGPYRVIFDTGAPISLLNNKVARAGKVIPKDFRPPIFSLFGSMGQFKIKKLEVGGIASENVPVMVMDHPTVETIARAFGPIEGIVGLSFFGRYRMTIDYQAKEMTFVPTDFEPPDLMSVLMKALLANSPDAKRIVSPSGLLGIRVGKDADDKQPGVVIREVFPGSPADQAGLKADDRLLTFDSRWTDTVLDCFEAASHLRPGATAVAVVHRAGKELKLKIKVAAGF